MKKKSLWVLGALAWLAAGAGISFLLGVHKPVPVPPYAIEEGMDGRILCAVARDESRLCLAQPIEPGALVDKAWAQWNEDKEIMRAFAGVFTLAPPAFIFLVLYLIWRQGGVPQGFRKMEEEGFEPGRKPGAKS